MSKKQIFRIWIHGITKLTFLKLCDLQPTSSIFVWIIAIEQTLFITPSLIYTFVQYTDNSVYTRRRISCYCLEICFPNGNLYHGYKSTCIWGIHILTNNLQVEDGIWVSIPLVQFWQTLYTVGCLLRAEKNITSWLSYSWALFDIMVKLLHG